MIRICFDESYADEANAIVLGCAVAKTSRWKRFNREWASICKDLAIPYVHAVEMENRTGYFKDIDSARINKFRRRMARATRHLHLATSTRLDRETYERDYVSLFEGRKVGRKESMYSVCFRLALYKTLAHFSDKGWKPRGETRCDVLLEDSNNAPACLRVFQSLKRQPGIFSVELNDFKTDNKERLKLNAADFCAHTANSLERRSEPTLGSTKSLSYEQAREQAGGVPFLQLAVRPIDLKVCRDMCFTRNYKALFEASEEQIRETV